MHGRRKKDAIELSDEDKQRERDQLLTGLGLFREILEKRRQKVYTMHTHEITMKALQFNPEFSTLWNYRREIILHVGKGDAGLPMLQGELKLLEKVLHKAAKAYCVWFHRRWVLDQLVQRGSKAELLEAELALCDKHLQLSNRNFHCWGHRQWVIDRLRQLAPDTRPDKWDHQDLEFTTAQIDRDFSNYSAWHRRSLLPSKLLDAGAELETVKHAIFTEPGDQSVWGYHRWILAGGNQGGPGVPRRPMAPRATHMVLLDSQLYVCLSARAAVPDGVCSAKLSTGAGTVSGTLEPACIEGRGSNPRLPSAKEPLPSDVWKFKTDGAVTGGGELSLEGSLAIYDPSSADPVGVPVELVTQPRAIGGGAGWSPWCLRVPPESESLLLQELGMLDELLEIEEDCKYAVMARAQIVDSLGLDERNATDDWALLETLDPPRAGYYAQARADASMRKHLRSWLAAAESGMLGPLEWRGCCTPRVPRPLLVAALGVRELVLAENRMTMPALCDVLVVLGPGLLRLDAADNPLAGDLATVLSPAAVLEHLDVSRCEIGKWSGPYQGPLRSLVLTANPLVERLAGEGLQQALSDRWPSLDMSACHQDKDELVIKLS
mmetsp:Transcript_40023/g.87344  ORF Transcript_40023/g.87344 Transcript_40023/m.87344 type:complete len:606 (+) Transcript_40023:24-1841(+)